MEGELQGQVRVAFCEGGDLGGDVASNVEDTSCQSEDLAGRLTVTSVHLNCGTWIPLTPLSP